MLFRLSVIIFCSLIPVASAKFKLFHDDTFFSAVLLLFAFISLLFTTSVTKTGKSIKTGNSVLLNFSGK